MSPETDDKISFFLYNHGVTVAAGGIVVFGYLIGLSSALFGTAMWLLGLFTGASVIRWYKE